MAGLQLAPHLPVGVMLPYNKTEASGLHSTKQDLYEQSDSSQRSSVGHQRDNIQRKLWSNKELVLDSLYTHPKWNTLTKAGSYSYPRCAGISQQDSGTNSQGQGKDLFYSSDPQSWHPKANNQDTIPFTKKRVGVDRAYPLKPVVYRKSHSTGETGADEDQNVFSRPPEPGDFSYSSFGSRNQVNSSVVGPVLVAMQGQRVRAKLDRTERMQIQRLEAAGESLEGEIRRKETLLREKLKKTEKELRRIQKEKEQAEGNEKRELQRMTLSRRRGKDNTSNTTYKPVFSPELRPEEVFSRDRRESETRGQSKENSSPFQFPDYGIQRLKRERLMASNNKIQDQVSGPSTEKFSQPSEAPGNALWRSTSNSSLFRGPDSSGYSCSSEEPKLGECSHCGRKFLLLRLERHSNVCSRMQGSKRKVFDSSKARAKGTELEQYLNWKGPASVKAEPPRKSNWRQKHESFIRTLRQAREVQQVIAKGGNPSDLPPILPAENPDYIQCPHCSRHFAPQVAERHIPKCKTIKNRPPPPRKHYS
ncbi:zinc finger C2HC domain-containing protein 1C isoform X1 [Elephas maximus indicus]|uniref:zinc finger C2HC domain-containing protein 1C isoform X1 n=1 Tax=Elephas maximus indicus TaxID=99487 RepID=UPI00211690B1|nr:zinc finger C2HC domain-containing protein 1C isoform X1 [Elephas maximus indicus]XP_049753872.1 zinc finger C2HC domain-containing protein 1C isoform X1 [Elephas maximus indicus]XP_049753873.1 zinc finger C2HC domain-containing protein 1C isoform X1 [Elephas maximus indicus]